MATIHLTIGFSELGSAAINRLAERLSATPLTDGGVFGWKTKKRIRLGRDVIWDCRLWTRDKRKEYYRQAQKLTENVIFHVMLHDWTKTVSHPTADHTTNDNVPAEFLKQYEPWSDCDKYPAIFYYWRNNEIYASPFNSHITATHFGIYGSIVKDGKILLIKKTRGPYTGLYDLPGGKPEPKESYIDTLMREIKEETGCKAVSAAKERFGSVVFSDYTAQSGMSGILLHNAVLYDVDIKGEPQSDGDGRDAGGAVWADIKDLTVENATPYALKAAGLPLIATANENDDPNGIAIRSLPLKSDRYPMIAAVLLFNSRGNLVLQKIAAHKRWGGLWTYSAGGHVDAGEDYRTAAGRELKEEMGVEPAIEKEIAAFPLLRQGKLIAFHHVFIAHSDAAITPSPDEVAATREISLEVLKKEITQYPERFFDAFLTAIQLYFSARSENDETGNQTGGLKIDSI